MSVERNEGTTEFEVSDSFFRDVVAQDLAAIETPKEEAVDEETEEEEEATEEELEEEQEEAATSDDDEEEEEEEEEADEEEEEVKAKPSKLHTMTLEDGSQVKVSDEALIKIKVDGRFEKVKFSDLKSGYNGKVKSDEIIRRSSEAQKEAQSRLDAIKQEDERIRGHVKELSSAISKGGVMEALGIIAQMEGKSSSEVIKDWVSGLTTFVQEWDGLSDEERKAKVSKFELESEVKGLEAKKKRLSEDQQNQEMETQIKQACETHGVTREELKDAYEALEKRALQLKEAGKPVTEVTLDDVVATTIDFKVYDGLTVAAEELNVKLKNADINYLMTEVKESIKDKGGRLDTLDYVKLIKQYAKKELADLSRKVPAVKSAKTTPKSKKKEKVISLTRESDIWNVI